MIFMRLASKLEGEITVLEARLVMEIIRGLFAESQFADNVLKATQKSKTQRTLSGR